MILMEVRNPTVAIDMIIVKDGKILLGKIAKEWCKELYPSYGLVGSDILFGETIKDAIIRQLKSLLGIKLKTYKIISINNNFELGNHYITIGVIVEVKGEPKNLRPDDFESLVWFEKGKLPNNLFTPAKQTLYCYVNHKISDC